MSTNQLSKAYIDSLPMPKSYGVIIELVVSKTLGNMSDHRVRSYYKSVYAESQQEAIDLAASYAKHSCGLLKNGYSVDSINVGKVNLANIYRDDVTPYELRAEAYHELI